MLKLIKNYLKIFLHIIQHCPLIAGNLLFLRELSDTHATNFNPKYYVKNLKIIPICYHYYHYHLMQLVFPFFVKYFFLDQNKKLGVWIRIRIHMNIFGILDPYLDPHENLFGSETQLITLLGTGARTAPS